MGPPKKLPQTDALQVDESKVVEYLLNLKHPKGGSKAKYFRNRGFKPGDWQAMAKALKYHGATQTVTEAATTKHGRKFTVECTLETPDGKNPCILTGWIVEGRRPPRLVTAHPNS